MQAVDVSESTNVSGILFSDLDGTLLDHDSYRPSDAATAALRRLGLAGVTVVAVTSKTAAEVRMVLRELRLSLPAVVEGGGAILDRNGIERVIGLPRERLLPLLSMLRQAGVPVRGFSEMSAMELTTRSGLDAVSAARANIRSASEPFAVLDEVDLELERRIVETVEAGGACVTRGGRFWHLMGQDVDKASGVRLILEEWPGLTPPTAAVGDAWNDLTMLDLVDLGYLLGDAVPESKIPRGVTRLDEHGPAGFVEVVSRLFGRWSLPAVE